VWSGLGQYSPLPVNRPVIKSLQLRNFAYAKLLVASTPDKELLTFANERVGKETGVNVWSLGHCLVGQPAPFGGSRGTARRTLSICLQTKGGYGTESRAPNPPSQARSNLVYRGGTHQWPEGKPKVINGLTDTGTPGSSCSTLCICLTKWKGQSLCGKIVVRARNLGHYCIF